MHPLFLSLTGPGTWGQVPGLPCRVFFFFFCHLPPSACCELEHAVSAWIKELGGKGGGFPAELPREIPLRGERLSPAQSQPRGSGVTPQQPGVGTGAWGAFQLTSTK